MNANFQDAELAALAMSDDDARPRPTPEDVEPPASKQVHPYWPSAPVSAASYAVHAGLPVPSASAAAPSPCPSPSPSPSPEAHHAHGEATPTGRSDAASSLEADITPRSEMPSHPEAVHQHLLHFRTDAEPSYFSPQPLRILNPIPTSHTANDPSPTSTDAAGHMLGPSSAAGEHLDRPSFHRDPSSTSTTSVATVRASSVDSFQTPTATSATTPTSRQDGPHYPNQSYAALQSQQYHVSHIPHIFRAKSSHPTHHAGYSVSSISSFGMEHHRDIRDTGSRTVGNSPANSPGLFKTDSPPLHPSKQSDDNLYSTPWLHPAHRQAPKETHVADVDVDPVSGRKIVNHYEIIDELGRGVHGKVKLGRNLETNAHVAIKIVERHSKRRRLGKNTTHEDKIKREIAILKKARHPNIVSLLEVIDDPSVKKVYIVLEHVERGEVRWRTEGAKEVCQVEYRRYKRESHGIFENESEALEDERIMRIAHHKHELQRRRIAKMRRQRKLEFTENEPWSLELGGDSDDEYASTDGSRASAHHAEHSPTQFHRQSSNAAENDNMETAFRSTTPTATGLEGTMYGAYDTDASRGRAPSLADSGSSHFTDGEEEVPEHFRYVPLMTMQQAREVLRDTVLGLEYLHYQNVIHRDIKPANLLQTAEKRIKISDFGVSYLGRRPVDEDGDQSESDFQDADDAVELAKTVGTPAFYAPELCNTDVEAETPQIDHKIDIWALGVTLHCLIYGRVPFHDHNQWSLMKRIAEEEPYVSKYRLKPVQGTAESRPSSHGRTFQPMTASMRAPHDLEFEEIDDDLLDLFGKLFIKDPRQRITIEEIKRHPWLTRDLENFNSWFEETNPDKLSQGGKIKISKDDIEKAVVPITIMDRVKLGLRKVTEITRSLTRQGSRKRAPSTASSNEALHGMSANSSSSTISHDGRRPSLGPGMPIYEALSRSRESEHPLSQSVTASPEPSERLRYFDSPNSRTASPIQSVEGREHPSPMAALNRSNLLDRAFSTLSSAASIRTVRQSDLGRAVSPALPPTLPGAPTALDTLGCSSLGGIFGGMPKRAAHDARSDGKTLRLPREHTRAKSIDRLVGGDDDAHTVPSLAISTAFASGHVDQPDFPREVSPTFARATTPNFSEARTPDPQERAASRQSSISSMSSRLYRAWTAHSHDWETGPSPDLPILSQSPGARDTSDERFSRAKDEFVRRRVREENFNRERPRSGIYPRPSSALSQTMCPPSPDDDLYFQRQKVEDFLNHQHHPMPGSSPISYPIITQVQPRTITSSSSEDHFATMSQSTSNPSVPSIASASSSVVPDECHQMGSFPGMAPAASAESFINQFDAPSEDPAGYDGDHAVESEEDESSDEELVISLGKGRNRMRSESVSNAELARSSIHSSLSSRRRSGRSGSNGTVKKVPPSDTEIPSEAPADTTSG